MCRVCLCGLKTCRDGRGMRDGQERLCHQRPPPHCSSCAKLACSAHAMRTRPGEGTANTDTCMPPYACAGNAIQGRLKDQTWKPIALASLMKARTADSDHRTLGVSPNPPLQPGAAASGPSGMGPRGIRGAGGETSQGRSGGVEGAASGSVASQRLASGRPGAQV
mgnify:CR=1 FL=1